MMKRILSLLVSPPLAAGVGHGQLRFEAEDYHLPRDPWLKDKTVPNRWTFWSTDTDAERKWSGGVVLKSPPVSAYRATPQEGVPRLHTVLTGIPTSVSNVQIKCGRVLAVSLGGQTWRRAGDAGIGHGMGEGRIVELEDGRILLNARGGAAEKINTQKHRVYGRSDDAGEPFSAPVVRTEFK